MLSQCNSVQKRSRAYALQSIMVVACISLLSVEQSLVASVPYVNVRSQSAHLVYTMIGKKQRVDRFDEEAPYGDTSLVGAFSQSFRQGNIAECLFGPHLQDCDGAKQLTISGSARSDRGKQDWLADYFGLPTDFKSSITFDPRIRTFVLGAALSLALDDICAGLYLNVYAPFVHTRWDLGFCECVGDKGKADYLPGYFNSNGTAPGVERSKLLDSFKEFVVLGKSPDVNPTINLAPAGNAQILTPVRFKPLKHARISEKKLTKNGLADMRLSLGYNAYICDDYRVALGLTGAIPTGSRPRGEFAFEPIVGNGNHWEFGGHFAADWQLWKNKTEDQALTACIEAQLTHMFKARQKRTFDLKGKPNSRYMLAQNMGSPAYKLLYTTNDQTNYIVAAPAIPAQFKDVFMPVANLTTVNVDVSVGAHVDMVCMLNYTRNNLSFDIGYNLWARTCERIILNCKCPNRLTDGKSWALKGDAHVYGFGDTNGHVVSLSATQSNATILEGTNKTAATAAVVANRNPGVDSAQIAATNVIAAELLDSSLTSGLNIFTSKDPVFLTIDDIDYDSAATKGLSHTVFGALSYQWSEDTSCVPFVGVGFSVEVAPKNSSSDCCVTGENDQQDCSTGCARCGISQWSLWIQGGVSFD